MRYMLLVCGQEEPDDPAAQHPEDEPCWAPWARELQARGVLLVEGSQLQPVSMATTVRNSGDEVLVSDGPFAETKEQVAGFNVLACPSLAEACEIASQHPTARFGTLELRPFAQE